MSSAIPKAFFSIGVNAPAADARLQSPSENVPEPSSSCEYLETSDSVNHHLEGNRESLLHKL